MELTDFMGAFVVAEYRFALRGVTVRCTGQVVHETERSVWIKGTSVTKGDRFTIAETTTEIFGKKWIIQTQSTQ